MDGKAITIGLNIGTRYMGYAVIVGTDLRDWRLKVVKGKGLIGKFQWLSGVLSKLMEKYPPTLVSIKRLSSSRSSPLLERLADEAKAYLESHGVLVHELTLSRVKAGLFPGRRINKVQLAEYVVSQHRGLAMEWQRERSLKRPYRMMMFEAVALTMSPLPVK